MPSANENITCNIAMHIFILKLLKSTKAFTVEKAFQVQNHLLPTKSAHTSCYSSRTIQQMQWIYIALRQLIGLVIQRQGIPCGVSGLLMVFTNPCRHRKTFCRTPSCCQLTDQVKVVPGIVILFPPNPVVMGNCAFTRASPAPYINAQASNSFSPGHKSFEKKTREP